MGFAKENLNYKMKEIRWLTIIAPALFLISEDLIRHSIFPMPLETHFERGFFYAIQLTGINIFSQYIVKMFNNLLEQTKIQNRQLTMLNRVSSELNQSLNMEDELRKSLEVIAAYTNMEYAGILFEDSKEDLTDIEVSRAELDWQTCHVFALPLTSNANVLGTLKLAGEKALALDELMTTLTSVSQQIGVYIENARLYRRLQSANDYLNNVIESSGDAIIISDIDGKIRAWNKGAEQIYGYAKSEAIGRLLPMVPEDFKQEAFFHMQEISHGKIVANWETKRVTRTGKLKDINVTASPLKDESGNIIGVLGISKDISDKKELEQIIYQRNRDLAILNQIALELNRSDREQALETTLAAMRDYLNLEGICLYERLPNETYRLLAAECTRLERNDHCFNWLGQIDELEYLLAKEEFYYLKADSPQRFAVIPLRSKENPVGFLAVTENGKSDLNREARKVLINFANQLAVTLENKRLALEVQQLAVLKERERIAMDLHDGVIQSLYGMGLRMEGLLDEENPDLVKQDLNGYIDELNAVIQDIRDYIFSLRPRQLADRPLSAGIKDMANSLKFNHLINTNVTIDESLDGKLDKTTVDHILHIVKEALANVAKHAKATSVEVELQSAHNHLRLSVRDNGVGCPVPVGTNKGQGLLNMMKRAEEMGGKLSIAGGLGEGTRISLQLALKEGKA